MALDKKDRELLYELDLNSRQSLPQLARKIKLSKQVVDYRIKRLQENKIVNYYHTIISFTKLGYIQFKVYLKFQNFTPKRELEYIEWLGKQKNVVWIASCRDKYDLTITLLAPSVQEFGNILDHLTKDLAENILEKNILLVHYSPIFSKNYLTGNKEKKEIFYAQHPEQSVLDEKDQKIMQAISTNARAPIIELMQQTHLTRDILTYRLKKLKKDGIILQYSTFLNYQNLNLKLYKVMLRLKNFTPQQESKLRTYCKQQPNCVQFLKLLGNYDVEIEFEVFNEEEVYKIVTNLRNEFTGVIRDYNLLQITEQFKLSFCPG